MSCTATIVYPGAQFDPERVLETVARERCTVLYGVPTMFVAMLQHGRLTAFDLSSLRTGIVAGAPCPETLFRRIVEAMHLPELTVAYGMTETSPVSFQTERTDPLDLRASTVGTVHPHVEARIVDADGATAPVGASGEFCARGYCVMLGYWGDPDETAKVIDADGWMHTGDLAEIDGHGYCRIVGRIKDMIIRGGENIYPREIEDVLARHPAVADAHVIGVPDAKYGEDVCAWIKLESGCEADPQAILDFCKDRLAKHKIPRHIRFVLDYPKTASGKVQKAEMRRLMLEETSSADEGALSASSIDELLQSIREMRLEP